MKLTELLSGIETLQRAGAPETDITSLGFDSRHATAGQLFFPLGLIRFCHGGILRRFFYQYTIEL